MSGVRWGFYVVMQLSDPPLQALSFYTIDNSDRVIMSNVIAASPIDCAQRADSSAPVHMEHATGGSLRK